MSEAPNPTTTNLPVPEAPDEQGNYKGYRRNMWRKSWMQTLLPWATSLVVHVALLAVAIALLATVRKVLDSGDRIEQATVASAKLATENVGATPNVGNVDDVTSQNASLAPVESSTDYRSVGEGNSTADMLATAGGAASSSSTGITGMGELSSALGGGGGEGSPLFGEPGGGEGFMGMGTGGSGSDVYNIVFVCDSSGSMDGVPSILLFSELRKAIEPLEIGQAFNVVFFSDGDVRVAFPGELKPATGRFKDEAGDFLETVPMSGQTNPLPALEAAFAMEPAPQLIFFLTDGQFNGMVSYDDVVATIERLNANADTKAFVNTIQFINRDAQAEQVLKRIADVTGGEYRYVDRNYFDGN